MESGSQREKVAKKRNKKPSTSFVPSTFVEMLRTTCCSRNSEAAELRKGLNWLSKLLETSNVPESLFFIDLLLYFCHSHLPEALTENEDAQKNDNGSKSDADDVEESKSGAMDVSDASDQGTDVSMTVSPPASQTRKRGLEEPKSEEKVTRKSRRK